MKRREIQVKVPTSGYRSFKLREEVVTKGNEFGNVCYVIVTQAHRAGYNSSGGATEKEASPGKNFEKS